jgi:hypothetical protein
MIPNIEKDFQKKVCEQIRISSEGVGRYRVFTPFHFDDGDLLSVVLKKEGKRWALSDEGNIYMRLSYDLEEKDLQKGTRQKIITNALSLSHVHDREGELIVFIEDDNYGDYLYTFIQALLKISDENDG